LLEDDEAAPPAPLDDDEELPDPPPDPDELPEDDPPDDPPPGLTTVVLSRDSVHAGRSSAPNRATTITREMCMDTIALLCRGNCARR
jgi:hypothetical protein